MILSLTTVHENSLRRAGAPFDFAHASTSLGDGERSRTVSEVEPLPPPGRSRACGIGPTTPIFMAITHAHWLMAL
jgi:hypothetical protein